MPTPARVVILPEDTATLRNEEVNMTDPGPYQVVFIGQRIVRLLILHLDDFFGPVLRLVDERLDGMDGAITPGTKLEAGDPLIVLDIGGNAEADVVR